MAPIRVVGEDGHGEPVHRRQGERLGANDFFFFLLPFLLDLFDEQTWSPVKWKNQFPHKNESPMNWSNQWLDVPFGPNTCTGSDG